MTFECWQAADLYILSAYILGIVQTVVMCLFLLRKKSEIL